MDFIEVFLFPDAVLSIKQDFDTGKVYFGTGFVSDSLFRANEDWSCLEEVVNNCPFDGFICIINEQLYWKDRNNYTVNRLNLDGSGNDFMSDTSQDSYYKLLAVDHGEGVVYFTELNKVTRYGWLKKADIDFNVTTTVISNLAESHSVVLDEVERQLYVAEYHSAKILKYDLDTETESTLYAGGGDYRLVRDMAILNDRFLLASRKEPTYILAAMAKAGGSVVTITTNGLGSCGTFLSLQVLKDDQTFPTAEPCAATAPILYSCLPPTAGPATVHTSTAGPTTVHTTTAGQTTVQTSTAEPTYHTTTISDEASTAKNVVVGGSAIYQPKTLCFLNKEPVGVYTNQMRWVLDIPKDEVCRCKRVEVGRIHKKPVNRNFQPYYPTCPADILNKDEETTAEMLLC